jgi:hypothetical protein
MRLSRAAAYHLFASTDHPQRSLYLRIVAFIALLPLMAWLSWHASIAAPISGRYELAFCVAITFTFTHVIYILSDAAHRSFLYKLRPFHYMALRPSALRGMQLATYIPVTLGGGALIIPGVYKYCVLLTPATKLFVTIFAFSVVAILQVFMRTAGGWPGQVVQTISLVSTVGGLIVCWMLASPEGPAWGVWVVWATSAVYILLAWLAARRPPIPTRPAYVLNVREWERPGIIGSFAVRALRMGRYRGANIILFVIFFALASYAHQRPVVPFDAVALLSLLLCGTLGQEVRAVSRTRYPVELVMYGMISAWLRGIWALAAVNAALFIEILLITAIVLFHSAAGISYRQILCVGAGLSAIGIAAGSLVVSARDDVLAQLASTLLYGSLAYGFLRLLGVLHRYDIIVTVLIILISLALSYCVECIRWRRAIRGKYAALF